MNTTNLINQSDIQNETYLIVGVSAGPDSMALLDILRKNTNKLLVCVHINHNVRKESIEEEKYLQTYCKKNNIIFECHKIETYQTNNFENEARNKRYAFYEKILKKYHSHTLFLAHHGDDLIETVLMKIVRGSNIEGYAGIKMHSYQKNYQIIRPLIGHTKKEIFEYNRINHIDYFIDSSNEDITYTRNRFRHIILPILKKEDPNVHLKFLTYSKTLQEYHNYIQTITKEKIKDLYKDNLLNIPLFNLEPPLIQKNIIFSILSDIYQNKVNIIKNTHLENIIKLINSNKPNSEIDLPNNYLAIKTYNFLKIEKKHHTKKKSYHILLNDYQKINNIIIEKVSNIESNGNDVCRLNSKTIHMPLYIRNKLNGDRINLLGLDNSKKVKEIFIEKKIPKDIRDNYPILVDSQDNILWIPNLKKSKYNVKKNEFCDIILTSYKEREENNEKENK